MGEARARALHAWYRHSGEPLSRWEPPPPAGILYRWRQAHPKGRRFSCYDREFKVTLKTMAQLLQDRGQHLLDAALGRTPKSLKGARFQMPRKAGAE